MPQRTEGRSEMTDTGLQKIAFLVLLGLILYVAAAGGG